jgi:hypothetical protein
VLLAATLVVTIVGRTLAGRVRTRRDFFEAGGSLPWWAVSSSIIATVVSSVTFISVPAAVFRDGGNLGYVQVLLGLMLGKLLTAWVFARPYYLSTGVRTTYDYIGARVHPRVGRFSLGLGMTLSVINTAVKVLTTGLRAKRGHRMVAGGVRVLGGAVRHRLERAGGLENRHLDGLSAVRDLYRWRGVLHRLDQRSAGHELQ